MKMKILTLTITLALAVILVGAMMMPIIDDATNGDEVDFGNGSYYMAPISGDHVLTVTSSGVDLDGSALDGPAGCWIISNELNVYRAYGTYHIYTPSGQIDVSTTPYTITLSGTSATVSDGTNSETVDCTLAFVPTSEKTPYAYMKYNTEMHLNSIENVILCNMYGSSHFYAVENGVASIDGVETGATVSNNLVEVDGIDKVYTTSKIIIDHDNTSTTIGAGTVVPAEVQGIVEGSDSGPEVSLLSAIPIIVICALVLVAASTIVRRD